MDIDMTVDVDHEMDIDYEQKLTNHKESNKSNNDMNVDFEQ